MTNMDPVMEPIFTKMIPCPGVGILKMIPCSAARPRTEKYMSTPPPSSVPAGWEKLKLIQLQTMIRVVADDWGILFWGTKFAQL